jgi:uncharacterized membrane protein
MAVEQSWVVVAIAAALLYGVAPAFLMQSHVSPLQSAAAVFVGRSVVVLPSLAVSALGASDLWSVMSSSNWLWAVAYGVTSELASRCLARSRVMQGADPLVIQLINSCQCVVTMLLALWLCGRPFTRTTMLGVAALAVAVRCLSSTNPHTGNGNGVDGTKH